MKRGRRSERTTKGREGGATAGRDGGATRGDTTTSRRNEMMRGWCNKRMTKGREGGATRGRDGGVTRGDATPAGVMRWREGGASRGWRKRGDVTTIRHSEKTSGQCDEGTARWLATQLARGEILRKKGRRCDGMMRCGKRGVIFERGAKVRCDVWQAQWWTVKEKILSVIRLLNWRWVHLKVDNTGVMNNKRKTIKWVLTGVNLSVIFKSSKIPNK